MTVLCISLLTLVVAEMGLIIFLTESIRIEREENRRYYTRLRREYDIRIEELQKDLLIDEAIIGGKYGRKKS